MIMIRNLRILKNILFFSSLFFLGCVHHPTRVSVDPSVQPCRDMLEYYYPVEWSWEDAEAAEKFMRYLEKEYMPDIEFLISENTDVINALVINMYLHNLYESIQITETEKIEYYNENIHRFRDQPRYEIFSVFTSQRRQGLAFLRNIYEDEDFLEAVDKPLPDIQLVHSGWYLPDELPSFMLDLVKGLDPGETSGLYEAEEGFYIVHLSSLYQGRVLSFNNVKEEVREILRREKMKQQLGKIYQGE